MNDIAATSDNILLEDVPCPVCASWERSECTTSMDFDYWTTRHVFNIVLCNVCGLYYVSPRPAISEIEKIYPADYSGYQFSRIRNPIIRKGRAFMQKKKALRILDKVSKDVANPRIVDVGCGNPVLLELIREHDQRGAQLYGNDFSKETLEHIRSAGFIPLAGAFEELRWEEDFFDVIVMNQVLEHFFDIQAVLAKSRQLLKPGGALFIETPSSEGLDARIFRRKWWGGYHIPRHLQIFSLSSIRFALRNHGLEIESVAYVPSPNFWTHSLRNLLIQAGAPQFLTRRMNYKCVPCMAFFTLLDLVTKPWHPTSNMRVIARKPFSDTHASH